MPFSLPVDPAARVQRTARIAFSPLDDDWLAMDAEAGFFYSLNTVGARIWTLLEQPVSLNDLCAQLGREYAVDPDTCRADVVAVLQQMGEAGLIDVVPPGPGTHA